MNTAIGRAARPSRAHPTPGLHRAARLLWKVFWLPFWLGSTLPPPALPAGPDAAVAPGERSPAILGRIDRLRATIWRRRTGVILFRTTWLALATLDLWLGLRVLAGRETPLGPFLVIALLLLPLGAALVALAHPSRRHLAYALDRSFGLRERVSTALEEAGRGRLTGLRALQVIEATRVTDQVGRARAFRRQLPVREIILTAFAAGLGLVLLLTLLFGGSGRSRSGEGAPGAGSGPAVPGAADRPASRTDPRGDGSAGGLARGDRSPGQTAGGAKAEGQAGPAGEGAGGPSPAGARDLDTVAGALRDHAATRAAADALDAGDWDGAADALRDAGRNAPSMSPEARKGLSRDLRVAAGQLSDPRGQLGRDLNDAASALERPGAAGAPGAFDRVADDIERTGQGRDGAAGQPSGNQAAESSGRDANNSGGAGASPRGAGDTRSQPQTGPGTPPLGVDGKPVELPRGDRQGPTVDSQGGNGRGNGPRDPGSAAPGDGQLRQGEIGATGPDPNQVPLEQRGVVERYFTPRDEPRTGEE